MSSEESINVHIKDINKRKSGEAFHLLLSKPGQHGDGISEANSKLKTRLTPKKEISHVEIQSKIESAERRRKAKQQAILDSVKAEEEKLLKAKQKRAEASNNFSAQAEENLKNKMSQYEEKRCEHIQQKLEKLKEQDEKAQQVRQKKIEVQLSNAEEWLENNKKTQKGFLTQSILFYFNQKLGHLFSFFFESCIT